MADLDGLSLPDTPRLRIAFEQFLEEAIDCAIDTLHFGSTPERNTLVKMVLQMLMRGHQGDAVAEAEKLLEQTRGAIRGILPSDAEDEDGE